MQLTGLEFPKGLMRFAQLVKNEGVTLYAVGGSVRNTLLNLPISDIDICSSLRPEKVIELCRRNGLRVYPKGLAYGTVEICWNGERYEHTTFRSDSYPDGGAHRPSSVNFSCSLEDDAFRRDFSVNALYVDVLTGRLIDPTGGVEDLQNRILRTTSPDPRAVLADDGLRILRLIRFAGELGFDIEPNTFEAAKQLSGNLKSISSERIAAELNRLLVCDVRYGERSADKVFRALELLDRVGAIDIILPELARGRGLKQKPSHHRYDVLNHGLHTASETAPKLILRLAGLLHDVGKPYVHEKTGTMHEHNYVGEDISREIMQRLHYDKKTIDEVAFLVRNHMYDLNNTAKDSTLRVRFVIWGVERTLELAEIREADVHGSGIIRDRVKAADRWRSLIAQMQDEKVPFSVNELRCSGNNICQWLDIPASPEVGRIKFGLLKHCARFPKDNTPERLKVLAKDLL